MKDEDVMLRININNSDPVRSRGVGLKGSEWEILDNIADEMNTTRHNLTVWIMRDFIRRYNRGEIETITKKCLISL